MTQEAKLRIARAGKEIGEYGLWEANQKWIAGEISMSDDYWRSGMSRWGKLQDIKDELLAAKKPESSPTKAEPQAQTPVPPLPPAQPAPKEEPSPLVAIGIIVFVIGALTLLGGLASDATGSAIRQGVFAQHMTNGILLMILGVLLAKK